jgi:hypothetical protein
LVNFIILIFQAALAAIMNSAAANPLIAQMNQNPQLFNQLNTSPQIRQMMQLYMQQIKGPTSTSAGSIGKK